MLRELVLAREKARGLLLCLNVARGPIVGLWFLWVFFFVFFVFVFLFFFFGFHQGWDAGKWNQFVQTLSVQLD